MDKRISIVSAVRTPFGRFGGSLRDVEYFDLGTLPMKEVLVRVNLEGSQANEVYWGVGDTSVCKDVYTPVAARQTLLKAGFHILHHLWPSIKHVYSSTTYETDSRSGWN